MTKLVWNAVGTKYFETGIDRGVLYPANGVGVAWAGLTEVTESPTGAEARPYYIDGQKYLNVASSEEFEATITGFSCPPEFFPSDGVVGIQNGLFATQQPRKAFGLSYRTLIGNDTDGVDRGYKIHLVYNALAGTAERANATIGSDTSAPTVSWPLTTLPPSLTGRKPTAHFIIDSRYTPKGLLQYIEGVLYGTSALSPRLPMPQELSDLFKTEGPLTRRNLLLNPSYRIKSGVVEQRRNLITNPSFELDLVGWSPWAGTGGAQTATRVTTGGLFGTCFLRSTFTTVPSSGGGFPSAIVALAANNNYVGSAYIRPSVALTIAPQIQWYTSGTPTTSINAPTVLCPANVWTRVAMSAIVPAGSNQGQFRWYINGTGITAINQTLDIDGVLVELSQTVKTYFDGSTATSEGLVYSWLGTAHASSAVAIGYPEIRRNLALNPGAEASTGFSANNVANHTMSYDTTRKRSGTQSAKSTPLAPTIGTTANLAATFNVGGFPVPAFPGDVITASVYVDHNAAVQAQAYLQVSFLDSASAVIRTDTGVTITGLNPNGGFVDRVSTTSLAAPAGTIFVRILMVIQRMTGLVQAGETAWMDDVLVENGTGLNDFFSGATSASDGLSYAWTGSPNASASYSWGVAPGAGSPINAYLATAGVLNWVNGNSLRLFFQKDVLNGSIVAFSRLSPYPPTIIGDIRYARFDVKQIGGTSVGLRPRLLNCDVEGAFIDVLATVLSDNLNTTPDASTPAIINVGQIPSTINGFVRLIIYAVGTIPAGTMLELSNFMEEAGSNPGYAFDGSTPNTNANFYSWEGTPDASISDLNTWNDPNSYDADVIDGGSPLDGSDIVYDGGHP